MSSATTLRPVGTPAEQVGDPGRTYRILHLSDLHFGPVFLPHVAEEILRLSVDLEPDVVCMTGDLVTRAWYDAQFIAARAYIDRFAFPVVTCPGNHEVPQYNQYERYRDPLGKYRRYIHPEVNRVWEKDGLWLVSVNSTRSFSIQGGRLDRATIRWMEDALAEPGAQVKIVMLHHDLIPLPGVSERRILGNGAAAVKTMAAHGVDMVLAGHQHQSYVGDARDYYHDLTEGVIIVQAGTATSRRGLGHEVGRPSFNWIEIDADEARVTVYNWDEKDRSFDARTEHRLARDEALLETARVGRVTRRRLGGPG